MRRPSPWLVVVVVLLGILLLREPRVRQGDDVLLAWFLEHAQAHLPPAQVALIEIHREDLRSFPILPAKGSRAEATTAKKKLLRTVSPLEYALFLQAAMEFQPAVIALEPIVIWRTREKDQEQVFLDEAMRVPKLLVGMRLGESGPRDIATDEILSFSQVTGERGRLAEYPGVSHRPDDDIRLISTPGFINLPADRSDRVRVPMLFDYRGEIVPSFPLQAILLWLRTTPSDVKVELGRQILLPNGWKIPLHIDGTATINPVAAGSVRHVSLDQLLLAAQEHQSHRPPTVDLSGLNDQIVVLRAADDPLQPPNIFATAIATIQENAYPHRVSPLWDWLIVLAAALLSCFLWKIPKGDLILMALAMSAGYALLVLAILSQHRLWLPMQLPLALLWFLVIVRLFARDKAKSAAM
ncbi:MAG TPA: hypothetical protein VGI85_00330 [Chthoniobacterales bacterium]|jgi:hypothetical protein